MLLVFREDYLAQLSTLLARCPALPEHGERLLAPPIEALPTILRGPFERHPEAYPARITPELAAQLQAEIELRSDGSRLNLSEIEIACLRLWRDPDPSALYASKRFDGLLADTLARRPRVLHRRAAGRGRRAARAHGHGEWHAQRRLGG